MISDFSPDEVPLCVDLVEDDEDLREETEFSLMELGFRVRSFGNATEFYKAQLARPCTVAVLDIGLPGDEDGLAIARHLRATSATGIIMLTARGQLEDRLNGLRHGADAYLSKPVHMLELAETIRAVGRRVLASQDPTQSPDANATSTAKWRLLENGWVLSSPTGDRLKLTTAERQFVARLFSAEGQGVSRDELLDAVGGDQYLTDGHRIDAMASRLRRKALQHGLTLPLHAVRGSGYVFAAE